jgi:hypothetical protein
MLPGDKLIRKIFANGLAPSDAVIIVLSKTSITKPWVQKELDAAVVQTIEKETRIIPIRLDRCDIPACLRDGTLYQEITDLDNYDAEFERIVNSIYGQYDKPPLGERPVYVQPDILDIGDLTPIDSTIFEHACRIAMGKDHGDIVSGGRIVEELKGLGITEDQIIETQEILEDRYYIKVYKVLGPPHVYDFSISTFGFGQFVQTRVAGYEKIYADVARCLVREVSQNGTQPRPKEVAEELKQSRYVVEHIFRTLADHNLVKISETLGGMYVWQVSAELRRKVEGK